MQFGRAAMLRIRLAISACRGGYLTLQRNLGKHGFRHGVLLLCLFRPVSAAIAGGVCPSARFCPWAVPTTATKWTASIFRPKGGAAPPLHRVAVQIRTHNRRPARAARYGRSCLFPPGRQKKESPHALICPPHPKRSRRLRLLGRPGPALASLGHRRLRGRADALPQHLRAAGLDKTPLARRPAMDNRRCRRHDCGHPRRRDLARSLRPSRRSRNGTRRIHRRLARHGRVPQLRQTFLQCGS